MVFDGSLRGIAHPKWKGDDVGYMALHTWMRSNYPKIGRCERCGSKKKRTYYASKSHARYTRDREDWLELCAKCHAKYDEKSAKFIGRIFSTETKAKMSTSAKKRCSTPAARKRMKIASHKGRKKRDAATRQSHKDNPRLHDKFGKFTSRAVSDQLALSK